MTTMFRSVEEAKAVIASIAKIDLNAFKEVPDLKVVGMDYLLLDAPNTSEKFKQSIKDRINAQKGFKFTKDGQEVKIVIGPFRSGYDCWILGKNGIAQRI